MKKRKKYSKKEKIKWFWALDRRHRTKKTPASQRKKQISRRGYVAKINGWSPMSQGAVRLKAKLLDTSNRKRKESRVLLSVRL